MKQKIIRFTIFFLLLGVSVKAQTADDIIGKYISKSGGKEKWSSVKSQIITGIQTLKGMDFPFTISQKSPNMMRLEANIQGQSFIQCYDGTSAWTVNPFMGSGQPEVMQVDQAKEFIARAPIKPELFDYASNGDKVILNGKETIAGISYDKITLNKKDGTSKTIYFDPSTSLISFMSSTINSGPMQGKLLETTFSDYRDEQGMKLAHTVEMKIDHENFAKIITSTVKVNPPIDSKIFIMPSSK